MLAGLTAMNEHDINDAELGPVDPAAAQHHDASLCPECEGAGVLADGETCPVCDGSGQATGRTGGG